MKLWLPGAAASRILVVLMLGLQGPTLATTVQSLTLEEAVEMADLVVRGTAEEVSNELVTLSGGRQLPITKYAFRVQHRYVGESCPEVLNVVNPGGGELEDGTFVAVPAGFPKLTVGEECILLLEERPGGLHVITGLHQGRYRIVRSGKEGEAAFVVRNRATAHVVHRKINGEEDGHETASQFELSAFQERLRSAARQCGKTYRSPAGLRSQPEEEEMP